MKRRLFWKILIAFWLTFFAISQGVWLLFSLNRDDRRPPDPVHARYVSPIVLAALEQAVSRDGRAGFEALAARLPDSERGRLELSPLAAALQQRQDGRDAVFSREVGTPDGERLRVDYRYDERDGPRRYFLNMPPELLTLGMLGGLLFSAALAWYLTEPINRLRRGFDRLARGDLRTRLVPDMGRRRDEIADLAGDFDLMAQRLEQLVNVRDRLLHDVSHELRSPLARLQLAIALARQDPARIGSSLDRIDGEAVRLDRLVDELLTLSRAEHSAASGEDYFDLAGVVESVIHDARFEAQATGVGIAFDADIPDEEARPSLRGNAELVRRAIENVVRNALRFSSAGQVVTVSIEYRERAGDYLIEVSDEGPGVADERLPDLFEAFVRGDQAGTGFGLGLAIARRAIIAHGGTIEARNARQGGLRIDIRLPVQAT